MPDTCRLSRDVSFKGAWSTTNFALNKEVTVEIATARSPRSDIFAAFHRVVADITATACGYRQRSRNVCPEWSPRTSDGSTSPIAQYSRVSNVVLLHRSIIHRLQVVANRVSSLGRAQRMRRRVKGERAGRIGTVDVYTRVAFSYERVVAQYAQAATWRRIL